MRLASTRRGGGITGRGPAYVNNFALTGILSEQGFFIPDKTFKEPREIGFNVTSKHDHHFGAVFQFGQGAGDPAGIGQHQQIAQTDFGAGLVQHGATPVGQRQGGTGVVDIGAETAEQR